MARFDFYSATARYPSTVCYDTLSQASEGHLQEARSILGYHNAWECPVRGVRLYYGGHNPLPFFVASGEHTPWAANLLRSELPDHRVSRADVCEDFTHPGGFDEARAIIERICRPIGVKVIFIGDDHPGSRHGRTVYYGSEASDVRLRLYEKGLKEIGEGNAEADPDWFRLEVQTRPRKFRKEAASLMSELEFFGMARWTVQVAKDALGAFVPFQPDTSIKRGSPAERAIAHMTRQYGNAMRAYSAEFGRDALLRHIRHALDDTGHE
jgi:hypothetical protein